MAPPLTQEQIRQQGLEALLERLGPADTVRFLQHFNPGAGDYQTERIAWIDRLGIDEIAASIAARRDRNGPVRPSISPQ